MHEGRDQEGSGAGAVGPRSTSLPEFASPPARAPAAFGMTGQRKSKVESQKSKVQGPRGLIAAGALRPRNDREWSKATAEGCHSELCEGSDGGASPAQISRLDRLGMTGQRKSKVESQRSKVQSPRELIATGALRPRNDGERSKATAEGCHPELYEGSEGGKSRRSKVKGRRSRGHVS
jgi:hypothetical protein